MAGAVGSDRERVALRRAALAVALVLFSFVMMPWLNTWSVFVTPLGFFWIAVVLPLVMLVVCAAGSGLRLPFGIAGVGGLRAAEALSAFGFFAIIGGVFSSIGGGLALVIGLTMGFLFALLLLEPRGLMVEARSLPDYLSLRYRSEAVRYLTLGLCACAAVLLIAAQLAAGGWIAAQVVGVTPIAGIVVAALAIALLTFRAAGDPVRNGSGVLSLVALLGLGIVVIWVMVQQTGIVLPQLAYGGLLEDIVAREAVLEIPSRPYAVFADAAPSIGIAFGAGIGGAVLLQLLCHARAAGSGEQRDAALRGGVLWLVLIATALPALGVLAKLDVLGRFAETGGEPVANLFLHGARSGGALLPLDGLGGVEPESVAMAVPALSGASVWLTGLFALSVIALLAVAGGGVLRMLLAVCVSRMVPAEAVARSRLIAAVTMFLAACLALSGVSVLSLGALAHALLGAAVFAPLLLAIWWPRATGAGALAGMIGGAVTVIAFAAMGTSGIAILSAGALGLLVSLVLTVAISLLTEPTAAPAPAQETQRPYGLIADPEVLE